MKDVIILQERVALIGTGLRSLPEKLGKLKYARGSITGIERRDKRSEDCFGFWGRVLPECKSQAVKYVKNEKLGESRNLYS